MKPTNAISIALIALLWFGGIWLFNHFNPWIGIAVSGAALFSTFIFIKSKLT
jgi:hypothetical protein